MSGYMKSRLYQPTMWAGVKYHYIITTDQEQLDLVSERIDYKSTIQALKEKGYTNIFINCIGKSL